ncbi:MAG: hypothetical protein ACI8QS_003003 [Planctomycetota bacterium]|jgi:hypothetical protein
MYSAYSKADQLEGDPHPHPSCVRAGALEIARFLAQAQWQAEPGYEDRGMQVLDPEQRLAARTERHRLAGSFLLASIDHSLAQGIHQVYGGLGADGSVGRHLWIALASSNAEGAPAQSLAITLDRLPRASTLWPLDIEVECSGRVLGTLHVPRPEEADKDEAITLTVDLPEGITADPFIDVLLRSSSWVEEREHNGSPVAARLVS